MRFLVTDSEGINTTDTLVITTRHEMGSKLEKRHIPVYCIKEAPCFIEYGSIEKELDELINSHIAKVIESNELRILWNVIPDAQDGIFGLSCKQAIMAVDEWMELLKQKPEKIIFEVSSSNRWFCMVGKLVAENEGISIQIRYASWKEKLRGIRPEYFCVQKIYQNFIRYRNIMQLLFKSKLKNLKGGTYQFGFVLASDALRILFWSMPMINAQQKTFGEESRVLCIDCDKTYQKLIETGIFCDKLTDWFDKKTIGKEEREYKLYRRLLFKYMHKNLIYYYHGVDMTRIILSAFDQYLWCEKAYHYRWKMIYKSYFLHNLFWCIEPWCTTRYYQTNICCLVSNGAKHCRVNGEPLFYNHDLFREVYSYLFDYIFFPTVGVDLRRELYEPNQWGKKRFYASIRYSSIMSTWNKNKEKSVTEIKNIAVLPSGMYVEKNIAETDKILDCLGKFHVICKFHPNVESYPTILKYMNEKTGVTFIAASEAVEPVIEKADIVVTMFSTTMLDTMAAHKVCIVIPNDEKKHMISYMEKYLNIWNLSQLQSWISEIAFDVEKSKIWYQEQLKRQDAFFVEDETLDDAYTQLAKMYKDS